jgi:hypothetical protein
MWCSVLLFCNPDSNACLFCRRRVNTDPGRAAAHTDTRLGVMYRRIARRRGKQKAIVAVARVICEIAWILICDPGARFEELGPDYYTPRSRERQTRDKIRELSRLNPGMKVLLVPRRQPWPSRRHGRLTRTPSATTPSPIALRGVTPPTVPARPRDNRRALTSATVQARARHA